MNTGQLSDKEVVSRIKDYVYSHTPASIVRYGEGEAKVVAATLDDPVSMKTASKKIRRQMGFLPTRDDLVKIRSMILESMQNSDICGLLPGKKFSEEHLDAQKLLVEKHQKLNCNSDVCSCVVNTAIYENLGEILRNTKSLSVVGCRDVRSFFAENYNILDLAIYQTPSQFVMRSIDDPYEMKMYSQNFWPHMYEKIISEISVRNEGEVFLVGAGLLGKRICTEIKVRGGIAIDLGSKMDTMVGKITRGSGRPVLFEPWNNK